MWLEGFRNALQEALQRKTIIASFRDSGIHPFSIVPIRKRLDPENSERVDDVVRYPQAVIDDMMKYFIDSSDNLDSLFGGLDH